MTLSDLIHVGRVAAVAAFGILAGTGVTSLSVVGCAKTLDKVETFADPHDDTTLWDCRDRARKQFSDGGKTEAEAHTAYAAYVQCRCEAGLCTDGGVK